MGSFRSASAAVLVQHRRVVVDRVLSDPRVPGRPSRLVQLLRVVGLLVRLEPTVGLAFKLCVVAFLGESSRVCEHYVVSFQSLRLSLNLLVLVRLKLIALIFIATRVLLVARVVLIVPLLLVFLVLSFLGPLCGILLVVALLALVKLVASVLVRSAPIPSRAMRHVGAVSLLRIVRLE